MAECLTIEWPYYSQIYNASANMTTTTSGSLHFSYPGLGALFLGFIFINIIWSIVQFLDFQERNRLP